MSPLDTKPVVVDIFNIVGKNESFGLIRTAIKPGNGSHLTKQWRNYVAVTEKSDRTPSRSVFHGM